MANMKEPSAATSPTPPEIPGYELLGPIGTGGTAVVWKARQVSLDRLVAIKVLSPGLLQDDASRSAFLTEARAAAKISHPSVVGILDFGETSDGTPYYVMEYVEGVSLAVWLTQHQQMAPQQALLLGGIVADTLDAIWRQHQMIHCDIKPGNILLGTDGAVKLTDLGLARVVGAATEHADPDYIEGTPTYLAPEQIEGRDPDCRSDIYALGLTLYHTLTGRAPFEGLTLQQTLDAQQTDYLPDPCDLQPAIPACYGWLLAKMTAKDPARRPETWTAVAKDIRQIQEGKFPSPPYPEEDESTILLSPNHRPGSRAKTINLGAAAKKAIVLSASQQEHLKVKRPDARSAKRASSGGGFLRFLIFLILAGGVGFAIYHFGLKDNADFQATLHGKPKPVPSGKPNLDVHSASEQVGGSAIFGDLAAKPAAAPSKPAPEDELAPQLAGGGTSGTATPGSWNRPEFIEAAQQFNAALTAWQEYSKNPDPADPVLLQIASDAQQAAAKFEAIRPEAPASVPVTDYANQCYRLVNDARYARLDTAARRAAHRAAPKTRNDMLAPWPTPPTDPKDPFASRYMQLGYAWDMLPAPGDRTDATEFVFLLASFGLQPAADTRARADLAIHGPLACLMPMDKALRLVGATTPCPRRPVEGAPFPYGGFFYFEAPAGRYGTISPNTPPFPLIRLISDSEDRLVGVELVDPEPKPPMQHPPTTYTDGSKTFDFVTGRTAPTKGDIRLSHNTMRGQGTIRIDTEAVDFSAGTENAPIYRSVLILPESVGRNLLYHLIGAAD